MLTIAILSGTNRRGGNNAKVVDHIDAIYRALGQPTQIIDLAALPPEVISSSSYARLGGVQALCQSGLGMRRTSRGYARV